MTILGTVTLSDDLILSGLETAPDITVNQRRTLLGESVIQTAPVTGGRALVLSGENHFTLQQIQDVKSMAALGQPVTLTHHRGIFTVLITGTPVESTENHSDPTAEEWCSGEISLLEV